MSGHRSGRERMVRRAKTVPALATAAVVLTLTVPVWLPLAMIADLVRGRWRMPVARLLAFGVCWCWLEVLGVLRAAWLWATRRTHDEAAHYALMGWWAGALMRALSTTVGFRPHLEGGEALAGGDAVVLARHASLADSLLSAWAVCTQAGLQPRYVLKRELLQDPCLDIVGLRVPNHFLDREATDGAVELDALRRLGGTVGPGSVAVIFPEGTRANDAKRTRALERIAATDPIRAERLSRLRRLLPPRTAGSTALVEGAPHADLVLAWHTGFDGLDSFRGILDRLARPLPPVRFVTRRVPRAEVPTADGFAAWLDEQWLALDAEVDAALGAAEL
jgi:1-acyl-sn-glycerol-3-phosphate acyltransferase